MNLLPREKLILHGPEELNNSELLAIILGHATKKENVFDLSKRLIEEYGQAPLTVINSVAECEKVYNVGKVAAAKIIACFELGRRFFNSKSSQIKIMNAHDVFQYFIHMSTLKKEYICGLFLNTRHQVVHDEVLSIGTLESSHLHPRDVFTPALLNSAHTVIVVHNHPSGDPNPSESDLHLTKEIQKSGQLLRISLLDHIIIAKDGYFSFQEQGFL